MSAHYGSDTRGKDLPQLGIVVAERQPLVKGTNGLGAGIPGITPDFLLPDTGLVLQLVC